MSGKRNNKMRRHLDERKVLKRLKIVSELRELHRNLSKYKFENKKYNRLRGKK